MWALAAGCGGVKGEDPELLVEALQREPALAIGSPGAAPLGGVEGGADSGSAVATQRYTNCVAEETALRYYITALDPLGWRRVERPSRWVKRVGDRDASLYLEYSATRAAECHVTIYADYGTGLLGG